MLKIDVFVSRATDSDGKYGAYYNPAYSSGSSKHSYIVQEIMDITGAWKRSSVDRLRRVTPAKLFPSRRSSVSRSYEDISQNGG